MNIAVPLRERVLAAAAGSPSLTRRQGRRFAALGLAFSAAIAAVLFAIFRGAAGPPAEALGEAVRRAGGWALAAGALALLVLARGRSTLVRSPQLLSAATWASPVVLLLWLARFEGSDDAPFAGSVACFWLTLALAATPLVTFLGVRCGVEPHCPGTLGAAAAAMCGAWAQLPILLCCPTKGLAHAAMGHAAPLAVLAALGAIAGQRVLGRAPGPMTQTTVLEKSREKNPRSFDCAPPCSLRSARRTSMQR